MPNIIIIKYILNHHIFLFLSFLWHHHKPVTKSLAHSPLLMTAEPYIFIKHNTSQLLPFDTGLEYFLNISAQLLFSLNILSKINKGIVLRHSKTMDQ